jgi:hypothetical protein
MKPRTLLLRRRLWRLLAPLGKRRRDVTKDERYWIIREAIPYEYSDPEFSKWSDIQDRLYPLCDDILSRTAQTRAGLAVQVKAILMAAADLWDDPLAEDGSHEREAVSRFVGVMPAPLR